jgi:hypothetical protein
MTTTTPAPGYGPGDDLDRDGIPNLLDGATAFLTQGSMAWHRHVQSVCRAAPFDALQAGRRYCLALAEHAWLAPFPIEDADRVAKILRRQMAGDATAPAAMAEELVRLQQLWPNPMDPVGSFLRSALRGIPDFASIGIFNSRPAADRAKAVRTMRRLLVDAIAAQQQADLPKG